MYAVVPSGCHDDEGIPQWLVNRARTATIALQAGSQV
jgi:hypothetical protein